jgi:hypothetical protein
MAGTLTKILNVEKLGNFARITFSNGSFSDFHYFWLRHNCDSSRHSQTREKTLCSSRVPLSTTPTKTAIVDGGAGVAFDWDTNIGLF